MLEKESKQSILKALAEGKSWGCGGGEEGKGESYAGQGGAGKASNVTKFGPFWAPSSSNLDSLASESELSFAKPWPKVSAVIKNTP